MIDRNKPARTQIAQQRIWYRDIPNGHESSMVPHSR
jgi:hypothetical protein